MKLTADNGQFAAKLSNSEKYVKSFSSVLASAKSSLMGWGGALAGLAGAGSAVGLVALTKNTLDAIDETADLANALGTSIESLGGLHYAAQVAGTSIDAVDNALFKLTKNLGGTNEDTDAVAKAVERLGLSYEELKQKSPVDALMAISDAYRSNTDAYTKADIAQALFGRGAKNVVEILGMGSTAIRDFTKEGEKLGVVFSSLDAAKAEEAQRAMNKLALVFEGIRNTLAIELSPLVTELANQFIEWANSGDGLREKVAGALEEIAGDLVTIRGAAAGVSEAYKEVAYTFEAWRMDVDIIQKSINTLVLHDGESLKELIDSWSSKMKSFREETERQSKTMSSLGKLPGETDEGTQDDRMGGAAATYGDMSKAVKPEPTISEYDKALAKSGRDLFEQMLTPLEKYQDEMEKIEELKKKGVITSETYSRASQSAWEDYKRAIGEAGDLQSSLQEDAKRTTEENKTAQQKYNDEVSRLNKLKMAGLINNETYERGKSKAYQPIQDEMDSAAEPAKRAIEQAQQEANAIKDAMKTPVEAYMAEIDKLDSLKNQGLLDSETWARAAGKAFEDLQKSASDAYEPIRQIQEQMASEAQSIFEDTRTPLENYISKVERLDELFASGYLDQDTYMRAMAKQWEELSGGAESYEDTANRLLGKIGTARSGSSSASFAPSTAGVLLSQFNGGVRPDMMRDTNNILRQIANNTAGPQYAMAG